MTERKKICFFIGHRDAGPNVLDGLEQAIEQHITEYGVQEFVVGDYGKFDTWAMASLIMAKRKYPHITLTRLLPYHPGSRPVELPLTFDGSFYPPDMKKGPRRLAIVRANRYMVQNCDYLIAYLRYPDSNTQNLLDIARPRSNAGKLKITLL